MGVEHEELRAVIRAELKEAVGEALGDIGPLMSRLARIETTLQDADLSGVAGVLARLDRLQASVAELDRSENHELVGKLASLEATLAAARRSETDQLVGRLGRIEDQLRSIEVVADVEPEVVGHDEPAPQQADLLVRLMDLETAVANIAETLEHLDESVTTIDLTVFDEPLAALGRGLPSDNTSTVLRAMQELAETISSVLRQDRDLVLESVRELGTERRRDEVVFLLERIERRLGHALDSAGPPSLTVVPDRQ